MSLEKKTFIPELKWFQTKKIVYFDILIKNASNINIKFEENNFYFECLSNNNKYEIFFDLFQNINKDDSLYKVYDNFINVALIKTIDENWLSLTKEKNLYKNNIKVNWNSWIDSSDEEDQNENINNFDFQSMMHQMGGIQNMDLPDTELDLDENDNSEDCEECIDEK
jgi:hypothetical protein